jgi:hypothetical protein
MLPEFQRIPDPVERDGWVTRLARDLAVSEDALRDAVKRTKRTEYRAPSTLPPTHNSEPSTQHSDPPTRASQLTERILAILELRPELRPLAQDRLARYPLAEPAREDLSNYLAIVADREFEDQSLKVLTEDLEKTVADLYEIRLKQERERLEQEMRDAERIGDHAKITSLLARFNELT